LLAHRTQRRVVAAAAVIAAPSSLRESNSKCCGIACAVQSAAKTQSVFSSISVGVCGSQQKSQVQRQAQGCSCGLCTQRVQRENPLHEKQAPCNAERQRSKPQEWHAVLRGGEAQHLHRADIQRRVALRRFGSSVRAVVCRSCRTLGLGKMVIADAAPLKLFRGEVLLGSIARDAEHDNFPWFAGTFTPTPDFEPVRSLFARELQLMDSESWEEWDRTWSEIVAPGLRLEGHTVEPTSDLLIHIDGESTWWRS
jgi:hypothetical protein